MKFDLLSGGQRNQTCRSREILTFLAVILSVDISLLLSLLAMVSSNFKIIK